MSENLLYNSIITNTYIEFIKEHYPEIDTDSILEELGIESYELEDGGHWLTQDQVNHFYETVVRMTGNPNISREAGRHAALSKSYGILRQYIIGFITPSVAYWMLERIAGNISHHVSIKVKKLSYNSLEVTVTAMPGVKEKPYQCENRMGMLEAVAKIFTNEYAQIDHPDCMHKGGDCCRYIVTWKKSKSYSWRMAGKYLSVIGFLALIALFPVLSLQYWIVTGLLLTSLPLGIFLQAYRLEKKELLNNIESQGNAASELIKQINKSYNEALIVQEISQATSGILNLNELFDFIMETLKKRLGFNRGMIMVANADRDRLVHAASYGYEHELKEFLKNAAFNLNNPSSRGDMVLAFKRQRPFLVNDIKKTEGYLSKKSLEFVKKLNIQSFVCIPIVYEGKSEGVLAVDSPRPGRQLNKTDLSLLSGIASQIGISINNARIHQQIRESEERFRALGENAPDIIYTLDSNEFFTYVNPAWEKILGYERDKVIGKPFSDFIREKDIKHFKYYFERLKDGEETVKSTTGVILNKKGSERLFSISGSSNYDSKQKRTGIIGTMKDITAVEKTLDTLKVTLDNTIDAMATIVESRDPYTSGHQKRVTNIACAIAEEMGLSEDRINGIRMAAMVHDIGKINVPAEILSKPGKLTNIELTMIKSHPEVGYNILKNIEFMYPIAQIVYQHHERMDGSGYPTGLAGDEILIEARVIAVADVMEAMMSHRPYRPSLGIEKAMDEILKNKGTLYDSAAVDACIKLFKEKNFLFE